LEGGSRESLIAIGSTVPGRMRTPNLTEQVSPLIQTQVLDDCFNFGVGQPGPELLQKAFDMIKAASAAAFEDARNSPFLMQYGAVFGPQQYRQAVADFYSRQTESQTSAEEVILTTGISGGIEMMCTSLASPGDVAIVEQPTYFLVRNIFTSLGLETLPSPMSPDGSIDLAALSVELEALKQQGKRARLLYVVPVHSNPSALCKTREEKAGIIKFCKEWEITILADEVYELLNFGPRSVDSPPFRELCRDSTVVSLGSFSKICGPGLRLGWCLAAPEVCQKFRNNGVLSSGGGLNPVVGAIMASALDERLMDKLLLNEVCPTLSMKSKALVSAINKHLPGATFHVPEGGYFILLRFPEDVNATELVEIARSKFSVAYTPGARCLGAPNTARLSFAFYSAEEMEIGVKRLSEALEFYQKEKNREQG